MAEEYYNANPTPNNNQSSNEGATHEDLLREVELPNVSDLEEKYMDRSEKYIQAKIENMLAKKFGGATDQTPSLTQLLDKILNSTE